MSDVEVEHLKRKLERYISDGDDDHKILKVLSRLNNLQVSVNCLKETGIGKAVNGLRKYDGEVGVQARDLVAKWKADAATPAPEQFSWNSPPSPSSSASTSNGKRKQSTMSHHQTPAVNSSKRRQPDSHLQSIIAQLPDLEDDPSLIDIFAERAMPSTSYANSVINPELDVAIGMSRRDKTKVYSGRSRPRSFAQVPRLMDLCLRVLMDHVDQIEEMGPVPYHVIKPVLVSCTATQLRNLEDYNPHLIGDSDELWAKHCEKDFRMMELDEDYDSFRDAHYTKLFERAERLKNLTKSITIKNKERLEPVRQTKTLAAGETNFGKGPRIQRNFKNSAGSSGIKATMKAMAVPAPPARFRKSAAVGAAFAARPVAPKTAPLMQKSLKAFKSAFKR